MNGTASKAVAIRHGPEDVRKFLTSPRREGHARIPPQKGKAAAKIVDGVVVFKHACAPACTARTSTASSPAGIEERNACSAARHRRRSVSRSLYSSLLTASTKNQTFWTASAAESIDHYETVGAARTAPCWTSRSPFLPLPMRVAGSWAPRKSPATSPSASGPMSTPSSSCARSATAPRTCLRWFSRVARLTAGVDDPKAFAERFSTHLAGLAASLELLIQSDWRGVDIGDLVRAQLSHFCDLLGSRIVASTWNQS
jgi:HWE histidine kinase